MERRRFLALAAAASLAPLRTAAAGTDYASDKPGRWRDYARSMLDEKKLAPVVADRTAFFDALTTTCKPIRQHAAWRDPVGFEVAPKLSLTGSILHEVPPHPIPGIAMFQTFWFYRPKPGAEPVIGDESSLTLQVVVNSLRPFEPQSEPIAEDDAGLMFEEPKTYDSKSGVPRYDCGHLLTKRSAPPTAPVSKERLLGAWIRLAKQRPKDPYSQKEAARLGEQLASLSDAGKKEPAMLAGRGQWEHRLATGAEADAKTIHAVNPDFFDGSLPHSAIQLAIVLPFPHNLSYDVEPVKTTRLALARMPWQEIQETLA